MYIEFFEEKCIFGLFITYVLLHTTTTTTTHSYIILEIFGYVRAEGSRLNDTTFFRRKCIIGKIKMPNIFSWIIFFSPAHHARKIYYLPTNISFRRELAILYISFLIRQKLVSREKNP